MSRLFLLAPASWRKIFGSAPWVLLVLPYMVGMNGAAAQTLSVSPNPIVYPTPTVTDYDNGYGPTHRVTVTFTGSGNGEYFIRSTSASLGNGKSAGHVRFMRPCGSGPASGCGTWHTLGTTGAKIVPAISGDITFIVDFQVTSWAWSFDTPFTYQTDLVFSRSTGTTITVPFSIVVNPLLTMTTSSTSVSYPTPTVTNFDAGWLNASSTTSVTTKANTSHKLVIKAATTNFSSTNASAVIPAADQEWSTDVSGSWSAWTGLTTTNAIVASRSAGNHVTPFNIRHRQLLAWSRSRDGNHTLKVDYAVQQ